MPNRFSPVCRDFIKRTLNRDPDRRLTSDEALTHPFISGYANSPAFRDFPRLWQSLELQRAIEPEDARSIVNLAVEYSYRYPEMVILPKKSLESRLQPRSPRPVKLHRRSARWSTASPNSSNPSTHLPAGKLQVAVRLNAWQTTAEWPRNTCRDWSKRL